MKRPSSWSWRLFVLQFCCSLVPVTSPLRDSLAGRAHNRAVELYLVAVNNILRGALGRRPHYAGEGHADLSPQQLQKFPLVALTGKEVDKRIQRAVEVHETHGDVQRHLKGREISAVGARHQLTDHVLQDVNVIGAVADDKNQGDAADDADGLAAAAGLLR